MEVYSSPDARPYGPPDGSPDTIARTNTMTRAKVRSQKKITVLFGNFSQMADPHPPLLGTPYSKKKNYRLFCILDP